MSERPHSFVILYRVKIAFYISYPLLRWSVQCFFVVMTAQLLP